MKKQLFSLLMILIIAVAAMLRLYRLDTVPLSPYWEEVAVGYDAFSITQTGMDHHGHAWPVVAFESFGDFKPAFYFYPVAFMVRLIGLNVWAVRLPSAIAGISLVLVIGLMARWLANELAIKSTTQQKLIQVLAMSLAALSPWLIHFSHGGWESNFATALMMWGFWLILSQRRFRGGLVGVGLLGLSMYTYHAARIIAPGLFILSAGYRLWTHPQHKLIKTQVLKTFLLFILLIGLALPLVLPSNATAVSHRIQETGIFSDIAPIIESNLRRERANNSLISRIIYHRYTYFAKQMLSNGFSHLLPSYLLFDGDVNPRHGGLGGPLYPIDGLMILIGIGLMLSKNKKLSLLMMGWLAVVLLPASVSQAVPHSLRTLSAAPLWLLLSTLGIWQIIQWSFKWKQVVLFVFAAVYLLFFIRFYWHYLAVYPLDSASSWQAGYAELFSKLDAISDENTFLPVLVTREQGRPAMYYWFYHQTNPRLVQQLDATVHKDQGEFLEFENYRFIDRADQVDQKPAILAASPTFWASIDLDYQMLNQIEVGGTVVWQIGLIQ